MQVTTRFHNCNHQPLKFGKFLIQVNESSTEFTPFSWKVFLKMRHLLTVFFNNTFKEVSELLLYLDLLQILILACWNQKIKLRHIQNTNKYWRKYFFEKAFYFGKKENNFPIQKSMFNWFKNSTKTYKIIFWFIFLFIWVLLLLEYLKYFPYLFGHLFKYFQSQKFDCLLSLISSLSYQNLNYFSSMM